MAAAAENSGKSEMVPLIAVFAVISLLAVGAGWFIGSQVRQTMAARGVAEVAAADAEDVAVAEAGVDPEERAAIGKRPGRKTKSKKSSSHGGEPGAQDDASGEEANSHAVGPLASVQLDPIVANLGTDQGRWIRMEIAVVYEQAHGGISEVEKATINEAVIGMLRSRTAEELAGPSGFLQFREDLADTVAVSTGGKATATKVLSLVVE